MTMPASKMPQAPSQVTTTQVLPTPTPAQVIDGPVTRSHAKKLQQEVHALLCEIHFNINDNYILPKCSTLIVLRWKNGPVQVPKDTTKWTRESKMDQWKPRTDQCKEIFITFYSQKL